MHVVRLLGPFALLAALLTAPHPAAAASLSPAAASAWQRDLDYMVKCIEKYHPDAFHSISRAAFEQRVSLLRARIPNFDRAQAVLGLASIIALVHDAHTGFGLGTSPPVSFHALPIKVYQYSDGVFIQSAAPEYRSLVGAEILSVGGVPIATVLQRLLTVVMVTNDWTFRSQLAFQFKGEILHALGLSERDDAATLRVRGRPASAPSRLRRSRIPSASATSLGRRTAPIGSMPGPERHRSISGTSPNSTGTNGSPPRGRCTFSVTSS